MQSKSASHIMQKTLSLFLVIILLFTTAITAYADWTPPVANGSEGVGTGGGVVYAEVSNEELNTLSSSHLQH